MDMWLGLVGVKENVARQVQAVREHDKVWYAEAVQRVARERTESTAREGALIGSHQNVPKLLPPIPSAMLVFNKESFLSFVSDVLEGAQKAANRSDIIRLVVGAAESTRTNMYPRNMVGLDFVIPGYEYLKLDRSDRSCGGCAIFVKHGLQYRKVDIL